MLLIPLELIYESQIDHCIQYNNIICELMIEDRMRFKEMFRMSVEDSEFVIKHIDDNCSFENMCKYSTDVTGDAMLDENSF